MLSNFDGVLLLILLDMGAIDQEFGDLEHCSKQIILNLEGLERCLESLFV